MSANNRYAIIDAGTNTFKLVIFQAGADPLASVVHEEEIFVKLWESSYYEVKPAKMELAIATLQDFKVQATHWKVKDVMLFCTEAFRFSVNGPALLQRIESALSLRPQVLTGEQEAHIQAKAALHVARSHFYEPILAIDIGGGSTEFSVIYPHEEMVARAVSLALGGTAIYNKLSLPDPLDNDAIEQIKALAMEEGAIIFKWIGEENISTIIGSAGVFESIITMGQYPKTIREIAPEGLWEIDLKLFHELTQKAVKSTTAERLRWNGLKPARAPYIGAAFLLLQEIIMQGGIEKLFYSRYGLKEGLQLEAMGQM